MLKVRIELNAPSAAKCVHLYIITAFLNVVAVFILVFKCLTENNLIDRTVLIVIVSNVMGSRQFVLNKSLTLKVLTHAHKLGHLGCTLCHRICDMSGFSLLKRPFISHSRAQRKLWKVICQVGILRGIFGSVNHFVNAVMLEMWQCRFHIRRCFHLHREMCKWATDVTKKGFKFRVFSDEKQQLHAHECSRFWFSLPGYMMADKAF